MTHPSDLLSFWDFFQLYVKCQKLSIPLKKMHEEVCHTLQAAALGQLTDYQFFVVNIMPRVGKTKIIEALQAWMLAYFPDAQIITTSYSAELAMRSTRYVRSVLESAWFTQTFGETLGDVQQSHYFTTTAGGSVYGAGVGGTITGFGAGLKRPAGGFIVVDDPANPSEALSKVESENTKIWFENTLRSRRNSTEYTPIIVIAQRLSTDDLPGYLLEHYPNDTMHLKYPAFDVETQESNFPETITTKDLISLRDGPGAFTFAAQYMQEPVVFGGNLIRVDDFVYHELDTSHKFTNKIITCDTAMKAKQSADNTVLQCWGKIGNKAYLIDCTYGKWDSNKLLSFAQKFYKKHNLPESPVRRLLIEDKNSGTTLIQEFRRLGTPAEAIQTTKDKVTRVHEILPYIATHLVAIPRPTDPRHPWVPYFLSECAAFRADGKQAHDDAVDCMCFAINNLCARPVSVLEVITDPTAPARRATPTVDPWEERRRNFAAISS
jgi:predicted phage terminase large subunit-like protein